MTSSSTYSRLLVAIAALGGLLYGYDLGIIGAALLYLDKCVHLSESEVGLLASAIFIGSLASSFLGGALSDWLGRKKALIISAIFFCLSVVLIVMSWNFYSLFAGRLLQGLSAGMIAVVVPVFMTECAPAKTRGISATVFQLCITLGIAVAMAAGAYYQGSVDDQVAQVAGDAAKIFSIQDHAWRQMFFSSIWPAVVFLVVAFLVAESPRWLFRRGRKEEARKVLLLGRDAATVDLELREMEEVSGTAASTHAKHDSLLQRHYLLPLALAVFLMGINQATGICAVFTYPVLMLNQAGLSESAAAHTGVWLALTNFVTTIAGVLLVDRLGRKMLLKIGTGIILVALSVGVLTFWKVEKDRVDVKAELQAAVKDNRLEFPVAAKNGAPMQLSVQFAYDGQEQVKLVRSDAKEPVLVLAPGAQAKPGAKLEILRAKLSSAPGESTGYTAFACLILYIVGFAFGPGVCLWLMSAELLPTRIRSLGMGLGLLANSGVTVATTKYFLPIVGDYGYSAMWGIWALGTLIYFLFAAFILPETKGKTLEEIEACFANAKRDSTGKQLG